MQKITFSILLLFVYLTTWGQERQAMLFNGTGTSPEDKLIAMTIAGIVNMEEPNLFLMNVYETWSYNQTDETWRSIYEERGNTIFTETNDIQEVIDHFSDHIHGAVTYDPLLFYGNFSGQNFRWQAEVAAMIGGLSNCIPISHTNNSINIEKPDSVTIYDHFDSEDSFRISARLELPEHPWNNTNLTQEERYFSILDWALENLLEFTNTRAFYLREITDWAIQNRMFQLNLAGTESLNFYSLTDEKAMRIEQVMQYLQEAHPGEVFHVYGWMYPEPLVQWISAWGGSFHETLMGNLSWHHAFPADESFEYERPAHTEALAANLENKHYVLMLGSEGDAGNWVTGFQAGAWLSQARGDAPVGWGFNLHMFEMFPFLAQYYFDTATANDGFIAVTSPLGYAYPDVFPANYFNDAVAKSSELLTRYNIPSVYAYKHYNGAGVSTYRGIEISNNFNFNDLGSFTEAANIPLTILFDPALQTQQYYEQYGGLLYNHVNDNTFYSNVTDLNTVADRIIQKLDGETRPSFLLSNYQRFRSDGTGITGNNPADMTIPRVVELQNMVLNNNETGEHVEFVTPEKFTFLLQQYLVQLSAGNELQAYEPELSVYLTGKKQVMVNLHGLNGFETAQIRVIDMSGRVIWSEEQQFAGSPLKIDLEHIETGIYLLHYQEERFSGSEKFLVE